MRTAGSRLRTLATAVSVCAALAAIADEWAFGPSELPFPAGHLLQREVFPRATLESVVIGSPITDRYARFGRTPPEVLQLSGRYCVYFRYDPDLVDTPLTLVFLADGGLIEQKWLTHNGTKPPECDGLWTDVVDLTRYYDAAWCCPWPAQFLRPGRR